jgi:hypothetical protein
LSAPSQRQIAHHLQTHSDHSPLTFEVGIRRVFQVGARTEIHELQAAGFQVDDQVLVLKNGIMSLFFAYDDDVVNRDRQSGILPELKIILAEYQSILDRTHIA